ncbi:MAG: DUF1080 domain-containing protein [Verrucomicrobiales bacterium]|nr:DUF1080 domain-containing protein [Verrucomicrobiales bacterium]
MKLKLFLTFTLSLAIAVPAVADDVFTKHPGEDAAGFTTIFDGKTKNFSTEGNWQVQSDGSLKLTPREGEKGWQRYNHYIWLPGEYGDFVFDFEFMYGKGGNSGFYFRCADDIDPTKSGFEVQILDSYGVEKELGHHDMAGVIKTRGPLKNSSKPAGEWNRMTVSMKGDRLVVVLNGQLVQDFNLRKEKPEDKKLVEKGKICIQDHGQIFSVRNLRVKKLD